MSFRFSRPFASPLARLFLAVICLGAGSAVFETTFNNYLHDTFGLTAAQRGRLELPRESPGFLCSVFAGALFFLPEARMAAAAACAMALGLAGLAQVNLGYWSMLAWLFLWSCGAHLLMPTVASLTIQLSAEGRSGRRLGEVSFVRTLGSLAGSLFVWLVLRRLARPYHAGFLCAAAAAGAAALVFLRMPSLRTEERSPQRFVFKARYGVYYVLCILFGARKQVFLTFGPWVLIKVFHQPFDIFGKLWFAAAIAGLAFRPLLGRLIDRVGERAVLVADGVVLTAICLGYGFAGQWFEPQTAVRLLYACYVADLLMFSAGMARHTYVGKIAERKDDITPTLSLGVTLDHAVSMSAPWLGGLLWMRYGYPSVFLAAAGVAVATCIAALFVRTPAREA